MEMSVDADVDAELVHDPGEFRGLGVRAQRGKVHQGNPQGSLFRQLREARAQALQFSCTDLLRLFVIRGPLLLPPERPITLVSTGGSGHARLEAAEFGFRREDVWEIPEA